MQEPDLLFPVEADQAHYLTVMTNRWRWRTPSPAHEEARPCHSPSLLEGGAVTRCGLVVGEGEGVPLGECHAPPPSPTPQARDVGVAWQCVGVSEENMGADRKSPERKVSSSEAEASRADASPESSSDVGGVDVGVGVAEEGAGCLVVSLDSSRAASLTRTCRWSGFKKVNN